MQALDHDAGTATKSYDRTITKTVADAKKFLSRKNKEQQLEHQVSADVLVKRKERAEAYSMVARENATKYLEETKSKGKVSLAESFLVHNICLSREVSFPRWNKIHWLLA